MNKLFIIALSLGVMILSSCRSTSYTDPFDRPGSIVPVGSVLRLNQTLNFQPGYSRSFIQFGKAVTFGQIDERDPYCQFERYEPPVALTSLRSVQPDEFIVIASSNWEEFVRAGSDISLMVSIGWKAMFDRDDLNLSLKMKLQSARQPEIVALKCTVYAQPDYWNYLSVNQVKATLGAIVTLKIAASAPVHQS